jgi:hypothetical protein
MTKLGRMIAPYFRPTAPKSPAQRHRAARYKARKLAATLHLELETFRGETGVNVWPTKHIEDDPFDGDHYAEDWEDALGRIRSYAVIRALVK